MSFSYVIVDDDPIFNVILKKQLDQFPDLEHYDSFRDSVSALMGIQKIQPDILFLDVNIDTFSGFDIIESLENKPIIIMLSADPENKDKTFPLEVFAFLDKPIKNEILLKETIESIIKILQED